MAEHALSIRELKEEDIKKIAGYWTESDEKYLAGMGADKSKIPARHEWYSMLRNQINASYMEKQSYCLIWLLNGEAIGHSNVNKITYGSEAFLHMHVWNKENRRLGLGMEFLKLCLPVFIKNLELKKILCEPYALNDGPNKTLEKLGFRYIKTYRCIPGSINIEQDVNLWCLNTQIT